MSRRPAFPFLRLLAGGLILTQSGCTSALSSASLRAVVFDAVDALAENGADEPADNASATAGPDGLADADVDEALPADGPAPESLDAAIEQAVARLQDAGELDAEARATLLSILESTRPEDWSAAIDAFTASLTEHRPPPRPAAAEVIAAALVAPVEPEGDIAFPALAPPGTDGKEPAMLGAVAAARPVLPETAAQLLQPAAPSMTVTVIGAEEPVPLPTAPEEPDSSGKIAPRQTPDPEAEPGWTVTPLAAPPAFEIRNACFVSRVRGWGVVDRFPEAVFRPGQDVIVYFELERPSSRESPAGHLTSIDTVFRLVGPDGRQIGHWAFEPLDEVCHAPRRDYFARYFLRIPATAPGGPCRLCCLVTDRISGTSTETHLDLEVR